MDPQQQKQAEQRRLFTFSLTFMILWLGWFVVGPVLFPGLFPQKPQQQEQAKVEKDDEESDDEGTALNAPEKKGEKPGEQPADKPKPQLEDNPTKTVVLGSNDPESGYSLKVKLTSVGAAIQSAEFNEERYRNADRSFRKVQRPPLQIVGTNLKPDEDVEPLDRERKPLTFDLSVERIDKQLKKIVKGASLKTINWKVERLGTDDDNKDLFNEVVFAARTPDGKLEITKTYRLNRLKKEQAKDLAARNSDASTYTVDVVLGFKCLTEDDVEVSYVLQGPVGLPLENRDIARKYRDIKAGFLNEGGSITAQTITATDVVKAADNQTIEEWKKPLGYLGVDLQYFATLVVPGESQLEKPYFDRSRPALIEKSTVKKEYSDVSVELLSKSLEVSGKEGVEHKLKLYLGPKREDLLAAYKAEGVFDYGWFASISNLLVRLMRFFHSWGVPYGLAIIMLTICVRLMLFPLSKKQAMSGKKMKELQPLLNEIREKYKDDKQGMATAQMELYRKANFNPFGGCVLVFFQLPIFISLYQAIGNCIDLRLAKFFYIQDLSGMDSLFEFPFALPWLGVDFNLLPMITMVLYYAQQKMFMPPPANEEAAMQMKMMNFMMFFMGFLFYHVPAGLCVYFIASALWGMGERKIIDILPDPPPPPPQPELVDKNGRPIGPQPKKDGFLAKLFKQLQQAAEMQQTIQRQEEEKRKKDKK